MAQPLGTLEVKTLTLSMLALDALEKAGDCSVLHASHSTFPPRGGDVQKDRVTQLAEGVLAKLREKGVV